MFIHFECFIYSLVSVFNSSILLIGLKTLTNKEIQSQLASYADIPSSSEDDRFDQSNDSEADKNDVPQIIEDNDSD